MVIGTIGAIMQVAGMALGGSALVVGCEEAISDAIRPIKYQQLVNDVKSAVTTIAGETGKVSIIVIQEKN